MPKLQEQFNALSLEKKFQFLYHAVAMNKEFLINWAHTDFKREADDEFASIVNDTFSFLEPLLFPKLNKKKITAIEESIEGVNEGCGQFIDNMQDVTASNAFQKAYDATQALSGLTQALYDCFFENEQDFYDSDALNILLYSFFAYTELDPNSSISVEKAESICTVDKIFMQSHENWDNIPEENNLRASFNGFFNSVLAKL
jgi:hypothetical protein